jgi:hypothetical protein
MKYSQESEKSSQRKKEIIPDKVKKTTIIMSETQERDIVVQDALKRGRMSKAEPTSAVIEEKAVTEERINP